MVKITVVMKGKLFKRVYTSLVPRYLNYKYQMEHLKLFFTGKGYKILSITAERVGGDVWASTLSNL